MSKQQLLVNDLFNSPFFRSTVGFDRLIDACTTQNYPPYNITCHEPAEGEPWYEVKMALAGFSEDDIDITVKDRLLVVSGKSNILDDTADDVTVHFRAKGIAERSFVQKLSLDNHLEVDSAKLVNGMLTIKLVVNVPEELQPKQIPINK